MLGECKRKQHPEVDTAKGEGTMDIDEEDRNQPSAKRMKANRCEVTMTLSGSGGPEEMAFNRGHTLHLFNCPHGITDDDVKDHYGRHLGHVCVMAVRWLKNGYGNFLGQGIAAFSTAEQRARALALPGPWVRSQQVEVAAERKVNAEEPDRILALHDLHPSTVESDILKHYKAAGIERVIFTMSANWAVFTGNAIALFATANAVKAALHLGPVTISGIKSQAKIANFQGGKEVLIRGSTHLTDEIVKEQYNSFGGNCVLSIQWLTEPKTQAFLGKGFISFRSREIADKAVALGSFMLGKDKVEVLKTGHK